MINIRNRRSSRPLISHHPIEGSYERTRGTWTHYILLRKPYPNVSYAAGSTDKGKSTREKNELQERVQKFDESAAGRFTCGKGPLVLPKIENLYIANLRC